MASFLTADWRNLAILNFQVNPAKLQRLVPGGTELDIWNGRCYVSIVGFQFLNTRVLGFGIPLHRNFEEVNLRYYVRRRVNGEWRRGVSFVREIVPLDAVARLARTLYEEPYITLPMRQRVQPEQNLVEYSWKNHERWNYVRATIRGEPEPLIPGSEEEFICEHYWGYTRLEKGGALEYRVEHPPWRVWRVSHSDHDVDAGELFGESFTRPLMSRPVSAFVAEGSSVVVHKGVKIRQ